MNVSEILEELLRLEYPFLLTDHDPDIERYYYLRNTGQSRDAVYLFQTRLKVRYPDDEFRTWLMRCYRSRDPAFKSLLAKAYRALGERSLERIKRTIEYIAGKAGSYNPRDVYSTIRAAEDILVALPKDRYEAVGGIERLSRYAQALNFHEKAMVQAADLVRSYLTDSLSVVEEEIRRRETSRRKAAEAERQRLVKEDWASYIWQKKHGASRNALIDLSAVVFSPADLVRIEIPKTLARIEDQVLAYCVKYWNLINDVAFERILFLYSRKYASKNYDVFLAIRRGRQGKKRDDEILASVMSSLVTGYYYSIRGDRYLQRSWNAIKLSLQAQKPPLALPPPAKPSRPEPPKAAPKTKIAPSKLKKEKKIAPDRGEARRKLPAKRTPQPAIPVPAAARPAAPARTPAPAAARPEAPARTPSPATTAARQPAPARTPSPATTAARQPAPARTPFPAATAARQPAPAAPAPAATRQPAPARTPFPAATAARQPAPAAPAPAAPRPAAGERPPVKRPSGRRRKPREFIPKSLGTPGGSVSDRLRELSGRSYDVYQDRFLAKARGAIRKILGAGRGLFFALPEEAEDLVYQFLRVHYSDPYMNWGESEEKTALEKLGFTLESLNPVIDECYRSL
jgi:hypothetical protein